jgi:hypothetical protein
MAESTDVITDLTLRHPGWIFWLGRYSRRLWTLWVKGSQLVLDAATGDELTAKIREAESP